MKDVNGVRLKSGDRVKAWDFDKKDKVLRFFVGDDGSGSYPIMVSPDRVGYSAQKRTITIENFEFCKKTKKQ